MKGTLLNAIAARDACAQPFPRWTIENTLPAEALAGLLALPLDPPGGEAARGSRESRNDHRLYVDERLSRSFPIARDIAAAFQDSTVASAVAEAFSADIDGAFLRIEIARDVDGFWLAPHTDIGAKKLTWLLYLEGDEDLGTDFYWRPGEHYGRGPFRPGLSVVFTPSSNTWHGFEPRPIRGVRTSIIVNYVGAEWRDRSQLAFPLEPVRLRSSAAVR